MAPRIKGQEIQLQVIENGQATDFGDPRSFETEDQLEILKEGYLGETTDRRDSVYRGFSGRMEVHFENRNLIDFHARIVNKARRRTAGTRVNIRVTLNFPGGARVRVILQDVEFGPFPMGFGGRAEYGTITLNFEGSSTKII